MQDSVRAGMSVISFKPAEAFVVGSKVHIVHVLNICLWSFTSV